MSMGAVMEVKNKSIFMSNVDDGTGSNPQSGYFAVISAVGPFKNKEDADNYLKKHQ